MRIVFSIASLLILASLGLAQDKGQRILFHVTTVRQGQAKDWCETGECSATRYTVEGYSDVKGDTKVVEYVLECVEVVAQKPAPHLTITCDRVHAHNDYTARLYADAISFGDVKSDTTPEEPMKSAYKIVSEREADKKR